MDKLFRNAGHSASLIRLHEAWHRSQLGDHTFKKDPVERHRVRRSMDYCKTTMNEIGELLSVAVSSADHVRVNFIRLTLDFETRSGFWLITSIFLTCSEIVKTLCVCFMIF